MIVLLWCPICASWHGGRGRSLSFAAHQRSSSRSAAPTRTLFLHVVLFLAMSSQLLQMMWSLLRLLSTLSLLLFFWPPGASWPACNWEICLGRCGSSILTTCPVHLSQCLMMAVAMQSVFSSSNTLTFVESLVLTCMSRFSHTLCSWFLQGPC